MPPFEKQQPGTPIPATRHLLLASGSIILITLLAYANSFSGPFVFDDVPTILENQSIRQLWPLWEALSPPIEVYGLPVGGRPLVNLSLAVNYVFGGVYPSSYHALNLTIHLGASLLLFGVVRRTLLRSPLQEHFGAASLPLSMVVAAVWSIHPLQTESVTYVCQRAESLMAVCYLGTIYSFIRSTETRSPAVWRTLAVSVCLLGMACKEVMSTAPLVLLLYDRTFFAGTLGAVWQQRRWFYFALASTWLLLGMLVLGNLQRGGTAGFGTGVDPWAYALTQAQAIVHYLRLSFWPHPLIFDYGFTVVTNPATVLAPAIVLIALLTLTINGVYRRSALGFAGAWFFIILAPTSSFVPVATQTIAEHRMYLPLAAPIALLVLGLYRITPRYTFLVCSCVIALLTFATARRNLDYQTELGLWTDTIAKRPENSRAHGNLGILLYQSGQIPAAKASFETALKLRPNFPEARANLGSLYLGQGQTHEAMVHTAEALRLRPDLPDARSNLGLILKQLGRPDEAMNEFREVLRLHPRHFDTHHNLAIALLEAGLTSEAIEHFETTIRLKPNFADAHSNLGVAFMRSNQLIKAMGSLETALRLNPASGAARENLAGVRAQLEATPQNPLR